jgi:hypothetical protein
MSKHQILEIQLSLKIDTQEIYSTLTFCTLVKKREGQIWEFEFFFVVVYLST